jgi:hypothetical protein
MAFTEYTGDTTIIGALGTNPAERGLTTQEFKDKFDQFADEFVAWFNETHLPEVAEKAVVDEHLAETAPHAEVVDRTITVGVGKDFTTWQAAIDSLKKRIDSTITIQGDAGTYSENITVKGFYGSGELNILGDTVVSSDYVIETISIEKCSLPVKVKGLCSSTAAGVAFQVNSCQRVLFNVCRSIVSGAGYGFNIEASMAQVSACDISNRTIAIAAGVEATVASASCTGSGNTYGLYCNGAATIGKSGTQSGATTAEYTSDGGVIR